MRNVEEHLSFVKEQIAHYDRMAVKSRRDPDRLAIYSTICEKLRFMQADFEAELANPPADDTAEQVGDAEQSIPSIPLSKLPPGFFSNPLSLSPADLKGLPAEVITELNITPSDRLEATIIEMITLAGGTLILDKLIAGLYHVTGETHQRNNLTSKLYRMCKKGLIYGVPKKKGVYTTNQPLEGGVDLPDEVDEELC